MFLIELLISYDYWDWVNLLFVAAETTDKDNNR